MKEGGEDKWGPNTVRGREVELSCWETFLTTHFSNKSQSNTSQPLVVSTVSYGLAQGNNTLLDHEPSVAVKVNVAYLKLCVCVVC